MQQANNHGSFFKESFDSTMCHTLADCLSLTKWCVGHGHSRYCSLWIVGAWYCWTMKTCDSFCTKCWPPITASHVKMYIDLNNLFMLFQCIRSNTFIAPLSLHLFPVSNMTPASRVSCVFSQLSSEEVSLSKFKIRPFDLTYTYFLVVRAIFLNGRTYNINKFKLLLMG